MAWYAYCIGEKQAFPELARHRKPVPLESVHGVSGNQVFLYPASDLAVIVSEHNPADALNQKSGVDHARVIADCFKHSTVLPFRFGTVFNDDESLRKSIRSNQRQFLGNIDKLRGKTEMHLKILVDDCSCGRELSYLNPEKVGASTSPIFARPLPASASARPGLVPSASRCIDSSSLSTKRSAVASPNPAKWSSTSHTSSNESASSATRTNSKPPAR